ncbi:MAG TPA: hypothetical protein VF593_10890 [Chthoniobacteraceae bacterium]
MRSHSGEGNGFSPERRPAAEQGAALETTREETRVASRRIAATG